MEYLGRKQMNKLGYTEPLSNLDCLTYDIFIMIQNEITKIEAEESKKRK